MWRNEYGDAGGKKQQNLLLSINSACSFSLLLTSFVIRMGPFNALAQSSNGKHRCCFVVSCCGYSYI